MKPLTIATTRKELRRAIAKATKKIGRVLQAYEDREIPPDAERELWDLAKARTTCERRIIKLLKGRL